MSAQFTTGSVALDGMAGVILASLPAARFHATMPGHGNRRLAPADTG
jgi:hypothetical protein